MSTTADYDVAIVGAGDVGCAIARELARFELRVVLIEARPDIGAGTSKANTAILHTGYDSKPGTDESLLVARGHDLLLRYAAEVGIPLETTGALVVAWTEEQLARFPSIQDQALRNGYYRIRPVDGEELYRREPHLNPGALGALEVPDEHIICPWTPPLACATQAVLAGVELRLEERVTSLARLPGDGWLVTSSLRSLSASWVVNAAGLFADDVHRMAGHEGFTVRPRRGELMVFDKLSRPMVNHILLPVATARTKGVLISPTVFGNVLLGPTAVEVEDKDDTATTQEGVGFLRGVAQRIMPGLLKHEVTATYAGLRAATEHPDYQLIVDADDRYACAGGIRSTGLTSALAIAEFLRDQLDRAGLALRERPGGLPVIRMPNLGERSSRPYAQPDLIARDPSYGRVICYCERVTLGEIRDAIASHLPPRDLDGLRRRTRVLTGRCQGFYCGARVAELLATQCSRQFLPADSRPQ